MIEESYCEISQSSKNTHFEMTQKNIKGITTM